ncbi:hypothetical protein HY17_19200 [Hyphomonas sp. CY54-11-8]|nr:hypothetical protein HY17_19200 [Hyphomonas sp. CY54-11-8]
MQGSFRHALLLGRALYTATRKTEIIDDLLNLLIMPHTAFDFWSQI